MTPFRFHPDAEAEMLDAALFYEKQRKHLGSRFLASVRDAVSRITISPRIFQTVEGDVRRCLTKTFPYAVLFRDMPEQIVVIAVMHLHRDPNYWKERLI